MIKSFWTTKITLCNWHISLLKLAVYLIGVSIGALFADYFKPYIWLLLIVGLMLSAWLTVIWLQAMKETTPQ